MPNAICAHCGAEIAGRRRFCTYRCRDAAAPRVPCSECGQPSGWFAKDKRRGGKPVICNPCRRLKPPRKGPSVVEWCCAHCGERCTRPPTKGQRPKYCSETCQASAAWSRRYARRRGAFVEDVDRAAVFAADGYRCHLCGKMTRRNAVVPHPKAPTIDHVIPLAKGGTHEPANCRTACFLCNASKGDRGGGEQLLLIG